MLNLPGRSDRRADRQHIAAPTVIEVSAICDIDSSADGLLQ